MSKRGRTFIVAPTLQQSGGIYTSGYDQEDAVITPDPQKAELPSEAATSYPEFAHTSKQVLNDSLCNEDLSETQLPLAIEEELKFSVGDISENSLNDSLNYEDVEGKRIPETSSEKLHTKEALENVEVALSLQPFSIKAERINADSIATSNIVLRSPTCPDQVSPSLLANEGTAAPTHVPNAPKKIPSFGKKKNFKSVDTKGSLTLKNANTSVQNNSMLSHESDNTDTKHCDDDIVGHNKEFASQTSSEKMPIAKLAKKPKFSSSKTSPKKNKIPSNSTSEIVNDNNQDMKKAKRVLSSEEKEARRMEQERKKVEREMKRKENEQKKVERERKKKEKEQKRLDVEKKKIEKEQMKIEKELKKMEREQKKNIKQAKEGPKNLHEKKSVTNNESKAVIPPFTKGGESKLPSLHTSHDSKQTEKEIDLNVEDTNEKLATKELFTLEEKDTIISEEMKKPEIQSSNNASSSDNIDSTQNLYPVPTLDKNDELFDNTLKKAGIKRFKPPKQTSKEANPKKRKVNLGRRNETKDPSKTRKLSSNSFISSSKKQKRRAAFAESDSEDDFSEARAKRRRTKPVNFSGPVWVQCENIGCQKWRKLEGCADPSEVPDYWKCSMNTDPEHNKCSAPEEKWSDLNDSQEFIESLFVPGSIVWAKMDGYPWWPAMIEEDPDEESYYEMKEGCTLIPVKYHVVFFDTPVCRGWINSHNIRLLSDVEDANKEAHFSVAKKHIKSLQNGMKLAGIALKRPMKERVREFGFKRRYHFHKKKLEKI